MTPSPTPQMTSSALLCCSLGVLLAFLGSQVDGFFGGMMQGAGVVLCIFGAYLVGRLFREPKPSDDTWLPSRDGDR